MYVHSAEAASQVVGKMQREHYLASVIVWWEMSYQGVRKLHFCEKGVKTLAKVYEKTVLGRVK